MFLIRCIVVALLAGLLRWDGRIGGQNLLEEPLVVGVLVGLVFGDPVTGLIMGATLQLVFMGIVGIGASTPPDGLIGGIMGTVFAIESGLGVEAVVALAMPMGILGQSLGILARVVNAQFNHTVEKYAKVGDIRGINRTLWAGAWMFFIFTAVPVFLGSYFGVDLINAILNFIPQFVLDGLSRASRLLPALGLAILMRFLYDKQSAPYLVLGFLLSAYLKMPLLSITILGSVVAYLIYLNRKESRA